MTTNRALKIDKDRQYRVRLAQRVVLLGQTLVPGQTIVLRGDVLKTLLDKVEHAEPL